MALRTANMLAFGATLVVLLSISLLVESSGTGVKINNGQNNKKKNLYTVWIEKDGSLICSGSLLNRRWVLTAASCFRYEPEMRATWNLGDYRVMVGDTNIKVEDGQVAHLLNSMLVHPDYIPGNTTWEHNIAMLRLSSPVNPSNENVEFIDVAGEGLETVIARNRVCVMSSYGDRAVDKGAKFRQRLNVLLNDDIQCSKDRANYTATNICFSDKKYRRKTDRKACRGDEGAPLVCKVGKRFKQLAMNLEGSCAYRYNVGLSLANYAEWINLNMGTGLAGEITENYPNKMILIPGAYQLYWRAFDTVIVFEVHVKTLGWVGLGVSKAGKMFPGDVSVGSVLDNGTCTLKDYNNVAHRDPEIDESQDGKILACRQTETATMLKFAKPIVNSTDADADVDINFMLDGNYVIFAFGETDRLDYHFGNKNSKFINLL